MLSVLTYKENNVMNRRIQSLEKRVEKIKRELAQLGDLRPGSLSKQYNVCGNPNCRCKASPPKKHGPYYQLSSTRKGKSRSKFVRKEEVAAVRSQLKNYAKLRKLTERWVDLAEQLAILRLDKDKQS
jgi:hypothetical protein